MVGQTGVYLSNGRAMLSKWGRGEGVVHDQTIATNSPLNCSDQGVVIDDDDDDNDYDYDYYNIT